MAEIIIRPYHALPCECEVFTINGIVADKDDFGESNDTDWENRPDWGCGCKVFEAERKNKPEVLEKYGITLEEYLEVCDELEDKLYVGCCSWCS